MSGNPNIAVNVSIFIIFPFLYTSDLPKLLAPETDFKVRSKNLKEGKGTSGQLVVPEGPRFGLFLGVSGTN